MGVDRLKAIRDQRAQQAGTQDPYGSSPQQASSQRRANPYDQRDDTQYGGGSQTGQAGFGGYGQNTYNQPSQYDSQAQYGSSGGYGQQQPASYGGQGDYDNGYSYPPGNASQAEKGYGAPAGDDMNAFYNEIEEIKRDIADFTGSVDQIARLHQTLLNNVQPGNNTQNQQLEDMMERTRQQSVTLKERIKTLKRQPVTERAHAQRKQQIEFVSKRFMDAIERYQGEEKEYRERYRDRMARQFKIARPDATDAEVAAVVNGDQNVQIFAQEAMGGRYAQGLSVREEVRQRGEALKRIEKTIIELNDLMTDMAILVDQQDDDVNIIHENVESTNKYVTEGREQLDKAKVSARSYRKKRWICFFLTLIILIIVGIVVGVEVAKNVNSNSSSSNNSSS